MKNKVFSLIIITQIIFGQSIFAQQRGVGVKVKTSSGQSKEIKLYDGSYALIIGQSTYTAGWDNLPGVKTDVAEVEKALTKQGFQVETGVNLTSEQFKALMDKFISDYGYQTNNRLLIYFAGHGHTQKAGDGRDLGYIIPIDTPLPEKDDLGFRRKAISMDAVQAYARQIESKHAMFIFDSCFSGKLISREKVTIPAIILEDVSYPVRQFITAGAANQTVPDESIFRKAFTRGLEGEADRNNDGYITGTEIADYLKEKVTNTSDRAQTPQYGKIRDIELDKGDFVFISPLAKRETNTVASSVPNTVIIDTKEVETKLWDLIKDSNIIDDYKLYKDKYPNGIFIGQVNAKIEELNSAKNRAAEKWSRVKQIAKNLIKYDEIESFENGLARVEFQGEFGFIDEKGIEIITPNFTSISLFSEDLALVNSNSFTGLIDRSGKEIISLKKDNNYFVTSWSEGLATIRYKGQSGFIDKSGKEIIPAKYEDIGTFSEGLAPVKLKGKWGAIDKFGQQIIPTQYDYLGSFSQGLASVSINGKMGFIDKTGKMIIAPQYSIVSSFSNGIAAVKDSKTPLWGFIDINGKMLIQPEFIDVSPFLGGFYVVNVGTGKGLIDKTGRMIIEPKYDKVWCFALIKDGFIGVKLNGKKGFVDLNGKEYFDF